MIWGFVVEVTDLLENIISEVLVVLTLRQRRIIIIMVSAIIVIIIIEFYSLVSYFLSFVVNKNIQMQATDIYIVSSVSNITRMSFIILRLIPTNFDYNNK